MALWLKQSQAVTVVIGPMLDATDGATALSALTVATEINADIYKWDATATPPAPSRADMTLTASGGDNDCAHLANGYYSLELTATDTGTLGHIIITTNPTGGLPTWHLFQVVPANVFNSIVPGTDKLTVDAVEINSSATAAAKQALAAGVILPGTVFDDGGTYAAVLTPATSLVFYSDDITEATADHYNGRVVIFTSGALLGQALSITDYEFVASTYGKFTTSASTEVPGNDATFIIV